MIKSFKKRAAFLKTAIFYAFRTPKSELLNSVILLNYKSPAKNRIYLNVGSSSGGLGMLLGILVNYKRQVFPMEKPQEFIDFCLMGLERELLKPKKKTKRPVKQRIQKRRGERE